MPGLTNLAQPPFPDVDHYETHEFIWTMKHYGVLPAGDRETIMLRGQIRLAPTATARQTLATFEHFVELLRVDRNNDVSIVQQPFDIESGRALRGGDADGEGTQPRQFAVQIVRKTTP